MKIRLFHLILFCLIRLDSFSQATKLVTVKFKNSKEIFESFSVLKSDKKTKHGEYVAYFKSTDFNHFEPGNPHYFIKIKGNFSNGRKDGDWIEYSEPAVIKSKGNYQNDKKTGIWETIKENGQVIERFNYTTNTKLKPTISVALNYPHKALKAKQEGVVILSYKISADCSISEVKVVKSLSPECDAEALNSLKKFEAFSKKYGASCKEDEKEQRFSFQIK